MKKFLLIILFSTQGLYSFFVLQNLYNMSMGKMYKAYRAYESENYEQALDLYDDSMQYDPYNPELNYNIGTVLYRQNKLQDAEQSFLRVLDKKSICSPELYKRAAFNLGNTCFQEKKWQDAIDAYDKVLAIDQHHEDALFNKALAWYKLQEELQKKEQKNEQQDQSCQCDNPEQQDGASEEKNQSSSGQQQKDQQSTQSEKSDAKEQTVEKNQKSDQKLEQQKNDQAQKSENGDSLEQVDDGVQSEQKSDEIESEEQKSHDLQEHQSQDPLDQQQSLTEKQREDMQKDVLDGIDNLDYDYDKQEEVAEQKEKMHQMVPQKKEPELKNEFQQQYEEKASDDERLSDYHARVMKTLETLEEQIQKHTIKSKVAAQSSRDHGKKGW
jgi:Ca-activated chloride channel family protein